ALLGGGVRARWLLGLLLAGSVGVVGMFKLDVLKDYQKQRLTAFINPDADVSGRGFSWNYRQSLMPVGWARRQGLPAWSADEPQLRARAAHRLHLHRHRRGAGLRRGGPAAGAV